VVDDEVVGDDVVDAEPAGVAAEPPGVAAAASSVDPEPASVPSVDPALDGAGVRRSFFAHPEPLKWTAGAPMALRTGPAPHSGHAAGESP